MKQIVSIVLLAACVSIMAQKQSGQNKKRFWIFKKQELNEDCQVADNLAVIPEKEFNGHKENICIWSPPGFKEIDYEFELVSTFGNSKNNPHKKFIYLDYKKSDLTNDLIDWPLLLNNMMYSKKELKPYALKIKLKINWKTQKLTFYRNTVTYKHGKQDSDIYLIGVSLSEDEKTLCLGYRITSQAVCQGIRQLPEWYFCEHKIYALLIPKSVEKIIDTSCYFGPDCSGIP